MTERRRLPPWLTKPLTDPNRVRRVRETLERCRLNTVCDEARCPNRVDCFTRGTATFMVLGSRCTRNCRFCAVEHDAPEAIDADEPARVADAARTLGLKYVVLTSVTRDDLEDGGARHFAATIEAVRDALPEAGIEVLVPDFQGNGDAVDTVVAARPLVFGHNVETVPRLYAQARPEADYRRTLEVLRLAVDREDSPITKSAMMLGLGETRVEIEDTLADLRERDVSIVCLGQYLSPSERHRPVERYVTPGEFDELGRLAHDMGFSGVAAGPFVRSSYLAEESAALALAARHDALAPRVRKERS